MLVAESDSAAWIFGVPFLLFLAAPFYFAPKHIGARKRPIPDLIASLLTGLLGFIFIGTLEVVVETEISNATKAVIQAVGGCALFVIVFVVCRALVREPKSTSSKADGAAIPQAGLDAERIVRELIEKNSGLSRRVEDLSHRRKNLDDDLKTFKAALVRAYDAEQRGEPDAVGIVEGVRERGDPAELLAFLITRRNEANRDPIELNREIAAVAFLTGEEEHAEDAAGQILALLPSDPDAANRLDRL